jgi:hypothetical protein
MVGKFGGTLRPTILPLHLILGIVYSIKIESTHIYIYNPYIYIYIFHFVFWDVWLYLEACRYMSHPKGGGALTLFLRCFL